MHEAARLAAEARDTLTEEERLERARTFEAAEATLRPHLTAHCPRARIDTERGLLLLTPPPPPPMRVHYRILYSPQAAAAAVDAATAAARTAEDIETFAAPVEPSTMQQLMPSPADPYVDASGALPLPDGIEDIRGAVVALRAFGPCRYPSRLVCVPLPRRAPPPVGHFDWVGGVLRLSSHSRVPDTCDAHGIVTPDALPTDATATQQPTDAPSGLSAAADANTDADADADATTTPTLQSLAPPSSRILYTLDPSGAPPLLGSPTALEYDPLLGIPLPVSAPKDSLARVGTAEPPPCVVAISVVAGLWPSEPARFEAPHRLPPPASASLDPFTRVLTLSEPPPGVEYRYTLDGTAPSLASPCYTAPVRLPLPGDGSLPTECVLSLRVVAFPAPAVPSAELAVQLGVQSGTAWMTLAEPPPGHANPGA